MTERGNYDRSSRGNRDYYSNRGRPDDRRGPPRDKNINREHKTIDYWEDIRTVADIERDVGKNHVVFNIIMQRPVFMGGEMGYYRLNTFLKVDNHYLRLSTSVLATLANFFINNQNKILDAIDEVRGRNAKIDDMNSEHEKSNGRGSQRGDADRFSALDDDESEGDDEEYDEEEDEENSEKEGYDDQDGDDSPKAEPTEEAQETGGEDANNSSDTQPRRTRSSRKE